MLAACCAMQVNAFDHVRLVCSKHALSFPLRRVRRGLATPLNHLSPLPVAQPPAILLRERSGNKSVTKLALILVVYPPRVCCVVPLERRTGEISRVMRTQAGFSKLAYPTPDTAQPRQSLPAPVAAAVAASTGGSAAGEAAAAPAPAEGAAGAAAAEAPQPPPPPQPEEASLETLAGCLASGLRKRAAAICLRRVPASTLHFSPTQPYFP